MYKATHKKSQAWVQDEGIPSTMLTAVQGPPLEFFQITPNNVIFQTDWYSLIIIKLVKQFDIHSNILSLISILQDIVLQNFVI